MAIKFNWIDKNWEESLLWCPSQLYRKFELAKDKKHKVKATAYLRWRHEDPWTFSLMDENRNNFTIRDIPFKYFIDKEYKKAEKEAEKIIKETKKEFYEVISKFNSKK
ncbi:MAG: hypothetical protein QXF15_04075 [Candidatus Aenigmatarchaeota archaeon]